MKLAVAILLGAGDQPCEGLAGRTPLEAARLRAVENLARGGRVGGVATVPPKVTPSTESALAPLFGLDTTEGVPAAGPLLARALGVEIGPDELAFRLDLVNLYGGTVVDPTAGRLGDGEAEILVSCLRAELGSEALRFFTGWRWRSLLVVGDRRGERARTTSPALFFGEPLREHLPKRSEGEFLRSLMERAEAVLGEHEINAVRVDLGENPANGVWIWGGGRPAERPGLFGGRGVAVGGHPSFLGLALEARLGTRAVGTSGEEPGAVGEAALAALGEHDLVLALLEGGTLASRLGDAAGKKEYLEAVDEAVIAPLAERLVESGEGRLLVVVTHPAATDLRRDCHGVMPFLLAGPGTASYGGGAFTEAGAEAADLRVEHGWELLEFAGRS